MKTLWTEKFNPQPFEPVEPTESEFNRAWEWMMEKSDDGQLVRAGLCLILAHGISHEFHRAGYGLKSSQMAAVALYRRYCDKPTTSGIPKRKTAPGAIPKRKRATIPHHTLVDNIVTVPWRINP